jgi:hypothetical protein
MKKGSGGVIPSAARCRSLFEDPAVIGTRDLLLFLKHEREMLRSIESHDTLRPGSFGGSRTATDEESGFDGEEQEKQIPRADYSRVFK